MSNSVFPLSLPGLQAEVTVAPRFSTRIQSAVSMKETRASFSAYPLWDIDLAFEFLRSTAIFPELDKMLGFFLQMKGSWDNFLLAVPNDNAVVDMPFGVGDGVTVAFQLTRTRGAGGFSFTEPVQNINVLSNIKAAGTVVSGATYAVSSTGFITFATAPAAGASLTWTGSFYYRCRFVEDQANFQKFMQDLWKNGSVKMTGAPGNKV